MKTQAQNIADLATLLLIEGKATKDNFVEKAIELDSAKHLKVEEPARANSLNAVQRLINKIAKL